MGCLVAILSPDGAPIDTRLLRTMMDVAPYRASDANVVSAGGIGLGYVPLPNRREPAQPQSHEERLWAVIDGRLDDRANLMRRLERRVGRSLASSTDTELVIAAYECWGIHCAAALLGDFSFCIWDVEHRRLFCARDHLGVKPLYYARVGDTLVVSNVLRSVQRHPGVSQRLDDRALCDVLLFGLNVDQSRTTFADVARVPPAHTLTCSIDDDTRVNRYWSFQPGERRLKNANEYVERYSSTLRTVVGDRLADAPIGVLMSGGLDSSSVAATAAEILGPDLAGAGLRAYTLVYDSVAGDHERRCSSLVAHRLGISIEHHPADGYAWFERWNEGLLPPEPSTEPMTAMTADLLERVARHGSVALTGDGGDPALQPSTLVSLLGRTSPVALAKDLWQSAFRVPSLPPVGIRSIARQWFSRRSDVPRWLSKSLVRQCDPDARVSAVARLRAPFDGPRGAAANSVVDPWWTSMFETYDPGATQRAVELRYPLFDVRLVELAVSLPTHPWCVNKEIVRSAMRGRLPEEIRTRPKAPLAVDVQRLHGRWDAAAIVNTIGAAPAIAQYVDLGAFKRSVPSLDDPCTWAVTAVATWLRCAAASVHA
jgi:asparagine synthase (glutamine-hydrolysing)